MTEVLTFVTKVGLSIKKHPYLWILGFFLIWVAFLDQHSILDSISEYRQSLALEREKRAYLEKIRKDSKMLNELKTNDDNLVKFAREHYYMKAKDEDVYIVKEE